MEHRKTLLLSLRKGLALALVSVSSAVAAQLDGSFNHGWHFLRNDEPGAQSLSFDHHKWEIVTLPHTARIEALVAGKKNPQWQGVCWYRKSFKLPPESANKLVFLRFDGAMNSAGIWVNGESAGKFMGGYLPYVIDISKFTRPGSTNLVAVRLDNRDNPITGPKPLADLDFNLYSGLYRPAHLILKNKLHITDPILAGKVASGGIFVTFPQVSKDSAIVKVQTHVKNSDDRARTFSIKTTLLDLAGNAVAAIESNPEPLPVNADRQVTQELRVANPKLWAPASPSLYQVRAELLENGATVDAEQTPVGIRRIEITRDGFRINGDRMFLRGCNRHQEYPYVGNAVSDAAQYRDALKIKEAGFDYVRVSHYPQSTAFLDACDELGIVVMNCLMGWQYFGKDPAFAELKFRECRELVRRDRNHPSVILWEVSLNESRMPESFITKSHAIAREEYPGDQCYTCGWTKGYDVFIQARQHGGCRKVTDMPCVVSEYGDWEYFAQNAGLEQDKWKDLQPAHRNSRQLRGDGELRLLQQALNFQEAHNDNLKTRAFADGIWVMFDYNRGYADESEASGIMDIFRVPKFAWWFFRTQRNPDEMIARNQVGPATFIANYWTPESPLEVRVFSNCEEVALHLNGKLIERRRPDTSRTSTHLKHPPFTFKLPSFEPGTLKATGYLGGREAVTHERRTPGKPARLALRFDLSGKPFSESGKDMLFCHVDLLDDAGTIVPLNTTPISLGAQGIRVLGQNPIPTEAGIASALLESDTPQPACATYALALIQEGDRTQILSATGSPAGTPAPESTVRYTTDGSNPSVNSPRYQSPIHKSSQVRAAIFVADKIVAQASSPGSPATKPFPNASDTKSQKPRLTLQ